MLVMVIEHIKPGQEDAVGERFQRAGRMLPDGVQYLASWIEGANVRCFQLMETPSVEALGPWIERWRDLVDFEVVPVKTSAEFWAQPKVQGGAAS